MQCWGEVRDEVQTGFKVSFMPSSILWIAPSEFLKTSLLLNYIALSYYCTLKLLLKVSFWLHKNPALALDTLYN